MEEYFDLDKVKAKVNLLSASDNKNMAMVTDEQLMIIRKGNKLLYSFYQLRHLKISSKKMLFPLLVGGVLAPFSFLSYFANMFHPLFHLFSTLIGLFLLYIGWAGRPTLNLILKNGDEEFIFLPSISHNLKAFVQYVNSSLVDNSTHHLHHLIFVKPDSGIFWGEDDSQLDFPKFGYTYQQMQEDPTLKKQLIAIDPSKTGREIKLTFDPKSNELRPEIAGPISKKAIVENSKLDF